MNSNLGSISKGQWNTMGAGTLAFFFDSWDAFLLVYVLSDIAAEFQISVSRVSLALVFTYASRWFGGILLGGISARFGRKRSLLVGILICGVFTILTGCATSFNMLLGLRLCFGIGMGGLYAAAGPLVMESVPASVRGFASGFFMFGFYVGSVVAPWTYYFFEPHFGWRAMFYFGGISLLMIPYVQFTVSESPAWKARAEELASGSPEDHKKLPMWKLFAPAYLAITIALLMVEFGVFFDAYPFQSVLPTYLKLERHFPIQTVALAGSMIGVGALFGSLLGGILSDRIGRKKTFAGAFVLAIIPTSIGVLAHNPMLVVVASIINGMIFGTMGGLLTAFENEHYPTDLRAVGNGLLHNLGAFGGAIGAVIATVLHVRFGYGPAIMMIAASGACLGLLGLSFTRETKNVSLHESDHGTIPV
jgi:MFS transporter, SHS family, lactate transporter